MLHNGTYHLCPPEFCDVGRLVMRMNLGLDRSHRCGEIHHSLWHQVFLMPDWVAPADIMKSS